MEYYTNQQQWQIQQPPLHMSESHSPPNDRPQSTDDWAKDPPGSVVASVPNQTHHNLHHPSLDIHDSDFSFGDIPVSNTTPTGASSYWPANYYYLPLTSYSTLHGANTASPTLPPPSSSQPSELEIDPSLTASVSTNQPITSVNPSSLLSYGYPQRPGTQSQFPLSVNPSLLSSSLSPSLTTSPITTTSTTPRSHFKSDLKQVFKPLLTTQKLTGSSAVSIIVKVLEAYGPQEVECEVRSDLFNQLTLQADDLFFKAWVENPAAMEITRNWLKAAAADRDNGPWKSSTNPILTALNRMRFSIQSLKAAKLGKIILKLTKDSNSATRDLSLDLEKKWRGLLTDPTETPMPISYKKSEDLEDIKLKKRRLSEVAQVKGPPPSKRMALASSAAVKVPIKKEPVMKKEPKVVVTSVKDAKSDSSFFDKKPKAKLPSFKKAIPATPSTSSTSQQIPGGAANIAQPSSYDPFKDAMLTMKRTISPKTEARATPPLSQSVAMLSKALQTGVRKKSVSFAPDGQLEQIRYIEKAIYDDDLSADNMHGLHNLRDLDRGEGAALHAPMFEEQLDWVDPLLVEIPFELSERGENSIEKTVQEEREKSTLGAVYMSGQIPDSPAEPSQSPPDDPDCEVKPMLLGEVIDALMREDVPMASVTDLLGQINSTLPNQTTESLVYPIAQQQAQVQPAMPLQSPGQATPNPLLSFLSSVSNEQVAQLFQQVGMPAQSVSNDANWGQFQNALQNQGYDFEDQSRRQWDSGDSGWGERGGRGRGRGASASGSRGAFRGKRRPCSFFAQGRCKYGDQCDFSHEAPSL